MKINVRLAPVTIFVLSLFSFSCERDDMVAIRSITTIEPVISGFFINTGGILLANRDIELVSYGVCYSTRPNPTLEDTVVEGTDLTIEREGGSYSMQFKCQVSLPQGATYYFRSYVETRTGFAYGNEVSVNMR